MGVLWNSNSNKTAEPSVTMADPVPPPKKGKSGRYGWGLFWLLVLIALVVLGFAIANEVRTSKLQAR